MILNRQNNGPAEAKALLGFIYKSNNFDNLKTYVSIAERDIKRVIGSEVFKLAEEHYNSDDYNQQDQANKQLLALDELVKYIQLPVLLHAYRRYAPLNDLSHAENGRQITVTNDLKPAFEWMIERDNNNLLDLAHEATDILLEYLDEQPDKLEDESNNPIAVTWNTSDAYSKTKDLFVNSAREFSNIFPINESRRLYLAIAPFIKEMELKHIRPIITDARYQIIKELIKDKDLESEGNEDFLEIYRLSIVPIVLFTMSISLKRLSVELLPDSVVQSFRAMDVKQSKTADSSTRVKLADLLELDARHELTSLVSFITSLSPPAPVIETETDLTQPFSIF